MSHWEVRALTDHTLVEAPNWLLAVSQALPELGHADASIADLVCDIQVDGVVRIYDPAGTLALLVREIPPEGVDRPRHVEPAGVQATGPVAPTEAEEASDGAFVTSEDSEDYEASEDSEAGAGGAELTWQDPAAPPTLELPPPSNLPTAAQEFSRPVPSLAEGGSTFDDEDLAFFGSFEGREEDEGPPADLTEELFLSSSSIGDAEDLESAAAEALAVLKGVVEAESGAVLYANINDTGLRFVAAVGPEADQLDGVQVPFGEGIAGFVYDTGASLIVHEARHDPRHHGEVDAQTGYRTSSILAASVRDVDGTIHGCIELLNPPERFRDWHLDAAKTVASALAEEIRVRF